MTSLKINTTKKSRSRVRNSEIQSQPNEIKPNRKNPLRQAKQTKEGQLGIRALNQRVTGELQAEKKHAPKNLQQAQAMEVDQGDGAKQASPEEIDPKDPYEKIRIDQNNCNDDIVCDACLDGEDDEHNEIVICDLCLGAVHQTCYGSELLQGVPEGNWYCARCRDLLAQPQKKCTEMKCIFCPNVDGILKPIG